jgi:hypothetical protein
MGNPLDAFRTQVVDCLRGREETWRCNLRLAGIGFAAMMPILVGVLDRPTPGAMARVIVVALVLGGLAYAASLVPRGSLLEHRTTATHVVLGDEPDYWFAGCECGWVEAPLKDEEAAVAAAQAHAPEREPEVVESRV